METSKRQMLYHLLAMRPNTREFPCLRPCLRPTFYAHISIEHCLRQLCPRPTCFAHPLRQSTEKLLPRYRKSVFWRNSFYKWCVPCAPVVPALASGALCAPGKGERVTRITMHPKANLHSFSKGRYQSNHKDTLSAKTCTPLSYNVMPVHTCYAKGMQHHRRRTNTNSLYPSQRMTSFTVTTCC